jgi:DNA-binding CsgD family transcriptional regulator/DNA-binding MarR family transcriptional regulator
LEYQDIESAAQLVMYLGRFWQLRGYYCEAAMWLERILAMQSMADQTRGKLQLSRGYVTQAQGDYENATAMVEDSLEIYITRGDISGIAQAKAVMGIIRVYQGEREKGIELLEESRKTFQESGDEWQTARALLYISDTYNRMGKNKTAVPLCHECLALFTKLGDPWGIAFASGIAGEIARKQGELQQAKQYFRKSLAFHWQNNMKGEIPYPLETLALIAISEQKFDRAVCLWGAAEAFREQANAPLPPAFQTDYHKSLAVAHEKLGEKAYIAALEQGRSLPLAQVIDLATYDDIVLTPIASTMGEEAVAEVRLTKREIEILRLVSTGMTDAQVAEMLFLSPRTISKHLESIYSKLQVNSRTAATHYALSHKLFESNL